MRHRDDLDRLIGTLSEDETMLVIEILEEIVGRLRRQIYFQKRRHPPDQTDSRLHSLDSEPSDDS